MTEPARPAFTVAFLLASPAMGFETFAAMVPLYGWPFSLVRLFAAACIAVAVALVVAKIQDRPAPGSRSPEPPSVSTAPSGFTASFDTLIEAAGPWLVVGIILATFLHAYLPATALDTIASPWVELLAVTLVSIPARLAASATALLLVVLVDRGLSPASTLVALLIVPAVNVSHLSLLRTTYGNRAATTAVTITVLVAWPLAFAADTWLPSATTLPTSILDRAPSSAVSTGSAALLTLILLRSLWLSGTRRWFATLFQSPGQRHGVHTSGPTVGSGQLDHAAAPQ